MSDTEEKSFELNTDLKETINEIENDIIDSGGVNDAELSGDEGVSTKNIQKTKKPRTDKQKEALRKAQEARRLKALKKKELDKQYEEDNEYFKRLTPAQRKQLKELAISKPPEVNQVKSKPRGRREKVVYESDPSSDEEVIIYKKKPKTLKKEKKKVVYQESSSSSEEEDMIVKQIQKTKNKSVKYEPAFSDEEQPEFSYGYQQPLTYSNIARFL